MILLLSCCVFKFRSWFFGWISWKGEFLNCSVVVITAPLKSLSLCQRPLERPALREQLRARPNTILWSLKFLLCLLLPFLCVQLCEGGKLSARDRAQRAWSAGYWARFVLEGRISKPRPTSPCDLANTTYVVLRAGTVSSPVRCEKASDYRALLGDVQGDSISHGFASKSEAKVYCLGAGIPYPEKVYQWS